MLLIMLYMIVYHTSYTMIWDKILNLNNSTIILVRPQLPENIIILSKLGAKINVIGPKEWLPKNLRKLPVRVFTDMRKGLENCDIVMMLRIQKERIVGKIMPDQRSYFKKYGLDYNKLKYAKKNAFVMHPGPMNRGVEIDSKLADDITISLIQEQVAMGVAVRMACLDLIIKNRDNNVS